MSKFIEEGGFYTRIASQFVASHIVGFIRLAGEYLKLIKTLIRTVFLNAPTVRHRRRELHDLRRYQHSGSSDTPRHIYISSL
jgi:hypothetical protein